MDVTSHPHYHDGRSTRGYTSERGTTGVGIREMTALRARDGHAESSAKQRRSFFSGTSRPADEIDRPTFPSRSIEDGRCHGITIESGSPKGAATEVTGNESEKYTVGENVVEPG